MAEHTRQQIYLLLEQNTNREKPLCGLGKPSTQITCKSGQTAWCKRSAQITEVRITSVFTCINLFHLSHLGLQKTSTKTIFRHYRKTLRGEIQTINVRAGLLHKHTWSGINTGSISITIRKVVLETELPKSSQNNLHNSWQELKENTFKMGKNGQLIVKAHR